VQIQEFLKFLSKKATAAAPRRDGEEKKAAAAAPRRDDEEKKSAAAAPLRPQRQRRYGHLWLNQHKNYVSEHYLQQLDI
jgi:hypothetical protein